MIIILFILVFIITHNKIVASKLYGVNATIIIFVLYCIVLYCITIMIFLVLIIIILILNYFFLTLIFGHFKTFFWIFNNIIGVPL